MKHTHSLFGEQRMLAFAGFDAPKPVAEQPENPMDEVAKRLQAMLDQGGNSPQEQAQINQAVEGFNNEVTDIRGGVFEELQSQGLLQPLGQQFDYVPMGGNYPYQNNGYGFNVQNGQWNDPMFGSYASALGPMRLWDNRTALMFPQNENDPMRIYDIRGPQDGPARLVAALNEYIHSGVAYPEIDAMLQNAIETRRDIVRKGVRAKLDAAKAELRMKRAGGKTGGQYEKTPDTGSKDKMSPNEKAAKAKELDAAIEKATKEYNDADAEVTRLEKSVKEGTATQAELDAARKNAGNLEKAMIKAQSKRQGLEGETVESVKKAK